MTKGPDSFESGPFSSNNPPLVLIEGQGKPVKFIKNHKVSFDVQKRAHSFLMPLGRSCWQGLVEERSRRLL